MKSLFIHTFMRMHAHACTCMSYAHRVDVSDVLSAVSYSLRAEVSLHVIISGPAYSSLINYISLLTQVRPLKPNLSMIRLMEVPNI